MSNYQFLKQELDAAGVLTVTLARPPANAVNGPMYQEIAALFKDPGEAVKAIVLTGAGPHFCAGNDLEEFGTMTPENGTERMWRVREASWRKPVVVKTDYAGGLAECVFGHFRREHERLVTLTMGST